MLTAQRNALAEVFERAAHLSLRVCCIRQTAKRTRLCFGGIQAASINKAFLVFVLAASDVPKREINVASEMMNTSQFSRQLALLGGSLRLIQQKQRFIQSLADPKTLSQSDLSLAASDIIRGCFHGIAV